MQNALVWSWAAKEAADKKKYHGLYILYSLCNARNQNQPQGKRQEQNYWNLHQNSAHELYLQGNTVLKHPILAFLKNCSYIHSISQRQINSSMAEPVCKLTRLGFQHRLGSVRLHCQHQFPAYLEVNRHYHSSHGSVPSWNNALGTQNPKLKHSNVHG